MKKEKRLIITIYASSDSYGAMGQNAEGIFAAGDTVREVKENTLEAIRLLKEEWPEDEWPEAIQEGWPVEWRLSEKSGRV